jgi:peptidoglycan-N-acetylglucosamine deacetylase
MSTRSVGKDSAMIALMSTRARPIADRTASFTVDVEQDCPPYLSTCRGMTDGMARLLDMLGERRLRATFFTTGEMARRFPAVLNRLVNEGHELGCHGDQHRDFTTLSRAEADAELRDSLLTLRQFASVISFRAPYLRFPTEFLPLLISHGLRVDSSAARYKWGKAHRIENSVPNLARIPASVTSSVLRLPHAVRAPWLAMAKKPLVLFVHPWEAVDFRRSSLRWDCRFRTGRVGVERWRAVIADLQRSGTKFVPLRELAGVAA